jgi:aryl-alcohol dehydrogenase-like predicted oxidoreductase
MVGPIAEQPPYSMLSRQLVEGEFAPVYDKYGLGIMCYSPLAGGVLTGKHGQGEYIHTTFNVIHTSYIHVM